MQENTEQELTEGVCCEEIETVKKVSLNKYQQRQTLWCINRDGDLYFVECPRCHEVEINRPHMFLCRDCGTFFSVYTEDGVKYFDVKVNLGIFVESEITLFKIKNNLYIVNTYDKVSILKQYKNEPDFKIIKIHRDLQKNGKDAHGHSKYKKYTLIPLN